MPTVFLYWRRTAVPLLRCYKSRDERAGYLHLSPTVSCPFRQQRAALTRPTIPSRCYSPRPRSSSSNSSSSVRLGVRLQLQAEMGRILRGSSKPHLETPVGGNRQLLYAVVDELLLP